MRTVFLTVGLVLLGAGGALTLQDAASSSGTATASLAASQDDAQAARRRGPRGRRGPAGFGQIQVVKGPSVNLSPVGAGTGTSEASCPGGTTVVGGGWEMPGVGGDPRVTRSPTTPWARTGWSPWRTPAGQWSRSTRRRCARDGAADGPWRPATSG